MNTAELFLWILDNLNYWVVALFMAIESSFIPFPSEVVVPPAAWKAMDPDSGMSFILVIVFATIGANIGALINYYLAKWVGRPIIYRFADSRIGHMCLIDRQKVEVAEEYFRKHGAASTIFGRLVPAVRQLISIPAGLAGMHVGKFLLYTTIGAGIWNTVLATIGWGIYQYTDYKTTQDVYQQALKYSHEGKIIVSIASRDQEELDTGYICFNGDNTIDMETIDLETAQTMGKINIRIDNIDVLEFNSLENTLLQYAHEN